MLRNIFKSPERQHMQNQTIFELYTDNNKLKYLPILQTLLNLLKINK